MRTATHTTVRLFSRSVDSRDAVRNVPRKRAFGVPAAEAMEGRTLLATFAVTTTADEGAGSLRAAIEASNATPGFDQVVFNIPGAGVQTIAPQSPLPAVTDPVIIDASTQPGWTRDPLIAIDGQHAGKDADGLVITAGDSVVLGLAIYGFRGNGVVIAGDRNLIFLNTVGIDPSGAEGHGNRGHGVLITGNNGFVAENTIAFNKGDGVAVVGGTGNDVVINSIFSNRGLGIDLGDDGPTPNDPLDADTGANELQNAPVLTGATAVEGGGVVVTGTLHTTPSTLVSLAFYTSPTAEGEGQVFQDTLDVFTDAEGNAAFAVALPGAASTDYVTATASSIVFGTETVTINSSEFSNAVTAAPPPITGTEGAMEDEEAA